MAEEVPDVVDAIKDHGWPLQRQTPRDTCNVLRANHRHRLTHMLLMLAHVVYAHASGAKVQY
jgi:hypothetical protein